MLEDLLEHSPAMLVTGVIQVRKASFPAHMKRIPNKGKLQNIVMYFVFSFIIHLVIVVRSCSSFPSLKYKLSETLDFQHVYF